MKKSVAIILLLLGVFIGKSAAVKVTLFGPTAYIRTSGAPDVFTAAFPAYPGTATLIVKNGSLVGENRIIDAISSAEILVNGETIFGPSDFNQKVYLLEATLNLVENNSITIELASKPDSFITVEVIAEVSPPTVTFSVSPASIFSGDSASLAWDTADTDACVIEPGIGPVAVSGSTAVAPVETTTYALTATGLGGSTSAEVTVSVVNRPPTADSQSITTDEDIPAPITLSGSDPDGDSLIFYIYSQPLHGNLTGALPDLTYTPFADYNGTDSFSFVANDGRVDSEPAAVNITVTAVNDAPLAFSQNLSLNEDESLAVVLTASDVDGDMLIFEIVEGPAHGALAGTGTDLIYAPHADYNGTDSFSFRANDGLLHSNTATVGLTILPVNDPPIADAGSAQAVFAGDRVTLDGSGSNDVDGDSLSFQWLLLSVPAGSTAVLSDASAVNPNFVADIAGDYEVELIVSDGTRSSSPAIVVIAAAPKLVVVPDVAGLSRSAAEAAIISADLTVGTVIEVNHDTVPADHVVSQAPAAGTSLEAGSGVDLIISLGPTMQVPAVEFNAVPPIIAQGEFVTLVWNSAHADSAHMDNGIGLVAAAGSTEVFPEHTTTYTLTVLGPGGSANSKITVYVSGNPEPQPEGSFGERYEDLVPTDATVASYDSNRFSLITGNVQDMMGLPIADVSVTIFSRPEYGTVLTDVDGRFSIPVEGGGILTVQYAKAGLLPAQRSIEVGWNDTAVAETVVLLAKDDASTVVRLDGSSNTVITAKSSDVTDEFGTRAHTMVFAGDTQAYFVDKDGHDIKALDSIRVRATEYATPESMPAELPPNTGFTYCAELTVDGTDRVRFDKPVVNWIGPDPYPNFPPGTKVPVGYYDPDKGYWLPEKDGVVVQLLDTDGDDVVDSLDADGDGQPDDLNANGSFQDEVLGLQDNQRYFAGSNYWRSETTHFSTIDWNFPFGPLPGSTKPNPKGIASADHESEQQAAGKTPPDEVECIASFVEQRSRILHQDIPIPGTNITLHYASSRVAGFKPGSFSIPASGDAVPASLIKIIVQLQVGGRQYEVELPPEPNQVAEIAWDGLDHLGRPVYGTVTAHIKIGFLYDGYYFLPARVAQSFGYPGVEATPYKTKREVILWQESQMSLLRSQGTIAEGWSLSTHHQVNPMDTSVLFKGDGGVNRNYGSLIDTVAGDGSNSTYYAGMGGPATKAKVPTPSALVMDRNGNLIILSSHLAGYQSWISHILKVDTKGVITELPFGWITQYGYGGHMAIDNQENLYYIGYIVWGGGKGEGGCVKKVSPDGIQTEVLGTCGAGNQSYDGVAVDEQGNIYVSQKAKHQVLKKDTAGFTTVIAGNGTRGHAGDGGPALQAQLYDPGEIFYQAGDLYIATYGRIRKVEPSGIITTVAGSGTYPTLGDGGAATEAYLTYIDSLFVDPKGNLYFGDGYRHSVRKVDTAGIISTAAGMNYTVSSGFGGYGGDGGAAPKAKMARVEGLWVDPSGNLFIADLYNNRVRKVGAFPAVLQDVMEETDSAFTEEGLGYILSIAGLHKKTVDLNTGVIVFEFGYDEENNLTSITDQFGNRVTIERDGYGVPTAIVSPDGIRTGLTINADDQITRITYANGSTHEFEYAQDGLMTLKIEPEGNSFEHVYDESGRLTDIYDQEGGHWSYTRTVTDSGEVRLEMTTGEGNITAYVDHRSSTGVYTSVVTDSSGATTEFSTSGDGLTANLRLSCDTDLLFHYDVDPVYKREVLKDITESTPAGLQKVTVMARTYQDTDADQVPDLITDTVKVNNNQKSIVDNVLESQKVITTPEGRSIILRYNPDTLLTETIAIPGLYDRNYGYDPKGRLTSISTNARQTTFAYDEQGLLESVTDPESRTTTYSHDPVGRITGINRPDGGHVGFGYDNNGNVTMLINPVDVEHGFGYNKINLSSSYTTPLSGSYQYLYNEERQLIGTSFPSGKQVLNFYDQGRLAQIQTPEGTVHFTYLCGSKIESVTKGAESITYGYDGKLVTSETLSGTLNHSLNYTYNNDFNVNSFAYAGGTVGYAYDNDRLLIGAGSYSIARNAQNGLPEGIAGGNLSISNSFNGYGELDARDLIVDNQNVAFWGLTRNHSGRISTRTETIDGVTSNYIYTYDPMGRLQTVTKDGVLVEEYGYDISGTRTYEMNALRGISGRSFEYSDEDHLLTAGTVIYAYDPDGFLSSKTDGTDITTYNYSSRGELLRANLPDGRIVEYIHDPLGRRTAKKIDGATVSKYLWQDLTRLLAVYDESDNLLMRFEYADDRMPVAMTAAGVTYYLAYDQVGSLKVVVDAVGNVVKRIDYDSFGNILNDSNPDFEMPFGFAGGLHDPDTGLVRFGYRDYDPDIGRWTAKDPIFFAGGDTDLYGYVLNDPIDAIDPKGLEIRIYSSDAFGYPGLNHAWVWSTEMEQGRGMDGSWFTTKGDGVRSLKSPYTVVPLPPGMTEEEFFDKIKEYPGWNKGQWFPWVNDCHSQLGKAFNYAGVPYPGAPNGRIDHDDVIKYNWELFLKNLGNLRNFYRIFGGY